MKHIGSLLVVFVLCGCSAPHFVKPLAPISEDSKDRQVYGSWIYVEESKKNEVVYVFVGLDEDMDRTKVVITGVGRDGEIGLLQFVAYTHQFENRNYLSFSELTTDSKEQSITIIQYEVVDNELVLKFMDDEVFAKAVKSGKIKGHISKAKFNPSISITDSQAKTRKFILKNQDKIFTEVLKLKAFDATLKAKCTDE